MERDKHTEEPVRFSAIEKQFVYSPWTDEPKSNGPRCYTCGDLAAWGMHPACEREDGSLLVWPPRLARRLAAGDTAS